MADPGAPAIGAAVPGITARAAKEAYDRATRVAVATRFHAGLATERAGMAALARNIFGCRRHGLRTDGERTDPGE